MTPAVGTWRARAHAAWDSRPRRHARVLVTFSGLDGAGKSTQVTQLKAALGGAGVRHRSVWSGFRTGRVIFQTVPFLTAAGRDPALADSAHVNPRVPRQFQGPVGMRLWVFTVALLNVSSMWWLVLRHGRRTDVLILDRAATDAAVKLDLHYGASKGLDIGWQQAVLHTLAPRADIGFYVAVSGEQAYRRKQEQTLEELIETEVLYEKHAPGFGLRRLVGTNPPAEIFRDVAAPVWAALRGR